MKKYRWGIVGLGGIAEEFALAFQNNNQQELVAAASRNLAKAQTFANKFAIPKAYGSYAELYQADDIDIVYIATPNKQHYPEIIAALTAGKHVLCEKAITLDHAELQTAMKLAEEKNLILAEAMTIFNMPLYTQLKKQMDSGRFGKLKTIQVSFGSSKEADPQNRFFNPELAGGALLDIGTYALSFARFFLTSQPNYLKSTMLPFSTGVDEQSVTIMRNPENEMAAVTLTFRAKMPKQGIVAFEDAFIVINDFPRADKAVIQFTDGTQEFIEAGNSGEAFQYEVTNIQKIITGELPNRSLFLTNEVIQLLDAMRNEWQNSF